MRPAAVLRPGMKAARLDRLPLSESAPIQLEAGLLRDAVLRRVMLGPWVAKRLRAAAGFRLLHMRSTLDSSQAQHDSLAEGRRSQIQTLPGSRVD